MPNLLIFFLVLLSYILQRFWSVNTVQILSSEHKNRFWTDKALFSLYKAHFVMYLYMIWTWHLHACLDSESVLYCSYLSFLFFSFILFLVWFNTAFDLININTDILINTVCARKKLSLTEIFLFSLYSCNTKYYISLRWFSELKYEYIKNLYVCLLNKNQKEGWKNKLKLDFV